MSKDSLYDFSVLDYLGNPLSLKQFQGKSLLFLVSSLHSPFTENYKELECLYQEFQKENFLILDFPTNDFKGETPENDLEIHQIREEEYNLTFPQMKKIHVLGEEASPLFLYLDKKKNFQGFDKGNPMSSLLSIYNLKKDSFYENHPGIKWTFTSFLVNSQGQVKKRFEATTPIERIRKGVLSLFDQTV